MRRTDILLEQFYTPLATAEWVIKVIRDQLWWLDIVEAIEPTAGKGAFIEALKAYTYLKLHSFDLEPKHPDIKSQDTLTVDVPSILHNVDKGCRTPINHVLLIGNPPFGHQASIAKQIWSHYAEYCGYTAFIVPRLMAFTNKIPSCHELLFSLTLPNSAFDLSNGKSKIINGVGLLVTRHKKLRGE